MQSRCCIKYVCTSGRPSSGHRTAKGQSSSQFPRRVVLKNVLIIKQLHSSPMLVRSFLKSCILGLSIMGTNNFQMFNLDLEKVEEPEIKLPTLLNHKESQGIPKKHLPLFQRVHQSLWLCRNKLWKALKEMGVSDHLTYLLRNLYVGQEATVRTLHETTDWFNIEKGVHQICLLSLCLFSLYTEHIMRNTRLDELQAEIKIGGRNINNLRFADDITLMAETKRNCKGPLDEGEGRQWKSQLTTKKKPTKQTNKKNHHQQQPKNQRSWHPAISLYGK